MAHLLHLPEKLAELNVLIGAPGKKADGSDASGLYDLIGALNRRLLPFEKFRERMWGAILVGTPMIAALWWLGGDKIGRFFHG